VLRDDCIKFARARGLSERAINFGHALKNTLVPVITIVGLQLGSVIAFAIITETVFQWPGMGLLFLIAVQNADIPVMAAYLLLVAAIFVTINLIVDLIYALLDPVFRSTPPPPHLPLTPPPPPPPPLLDRRSAFIKPPCRIFRSRPRLFLHPIESDGPCRDGDAGNRAGGGVGSLGRAA